MSQAAELPERFRPTDEQRRRFGARLDALGPLLLRVDPRADDAAEPLAALGPGAASRLLDGVLAGDGVLAASAPPALRELLDHVARPPAWVDLSADARGGALFLRSGPLGGVVLGLRSILLSYASPDANKPLVFSGRLLDKAGRRLMETARFVQAVCRPGGMRRGQPGFAIAVKVRLMHSQVRRLIRQSGRWRELAWGAPINQLDMLTTVLLFSFEFVEGLGRLGYPVGAAEREDVVRLWRHVGWVLGVEEQALPVSWDDARALNEVIVATRRPPDADARALVDAFLGFRERRATTRLARRAAREQATLNAALARVLIGDPLADELGVAAGGRYRSLPPLRPLVAALGALGRLPGADRLAARAGDHYWDALIRVSIGGDPIAYAPPAGLRAAAHDATHDHGRPPR